MELRLTGGKTYGLFVGSIGTEESRLPFGPINQAGYFYLLKYVQ